MFTVALRGYRRLSRALPELTQPISRSIGELCTDALSSAEKQEFTARCYRSSHHLKDDELAPLFPWEEAWLEAALPPAPASILVPAAGGGREVVALRTKGYTVFGFDPAITSSPNRHGIVRGSFEDLLGQHNGTLQLSGAPDAPVDAVLFGWGGLSHLYTDADRSAILNAAAACCPTGPLLISYWSTEDRPAPGTWFDFVQRCGTRLGRLRSLPKQTSLPCDFSPNAGLTTYLDRADITRYAFQLQRVAHFGGAPYAHATLIKPDLHPPS